MKGKVPTYEFYTSQMYQVPHLRICFTEEIKLRLKELEVQSAMMPGQTCASNYRLLRIPFKKESVPKKATEIL